MNMFSPLWFVSVNKACFRKEGGLAIYSTVHGTTKASQREGGKRFCEKVLHLQTAVLIRPRGRGGGHAGVNKGFVSALVLDVTLTQVFGFISKPRMSDQSSQVFF